jgi:hypothetical protein
MVGADGGAMVTRTEWSVARSRLMPVSAIDYISGHLMTYGAMVALARRVRRVHEARHEVAR